MLTATGWHRRPMMSRDDSSLRPRIQDDHLVTLAYELLDAHCDTVDLAAELARQPDWDAILNTCAHSRGGVVNCSPMPR
jgi:hypothetical protein